jgi:hypothetical protein
LMWGIIAESTWKHLQGQRIAVHDKLRHLA